MVVVFVCVFCLLFMMKWYFNEVVVMLIFGYGVVFYVWFVVYVVLFVGSLCLCWESVVVL